MRREAAMQLLRRWWPLAATVSPSQPGMMAWVGVYPLEPSRPSTLEVLRLFDKQALLDRGPLYRVRFFEVEERLALNDEVWLSEKDLHPRGDIISVGEDDLFCDLAKFGVGPDDLELPYKVDYPI